MVSSTARRPGDPAKLKNAHRAALATMIESSPIPAVHGVVRWRLVDLCQWLFEEVPDHGGDADLEPGIARAGLPQALRPPASPCPGPKGQSRILKKLPGAPRRDRAGEGRRSGRHRALVRRRGAGRPEEQDRPALGATRRQAVGALRSAHGLNLHLRRHLPERGQGRSPGPASSATPRR